MNTKQIKAGAILSYILIIVNTLYGLIFTPFLIKVLGDGQYGVYKIVASLTSSVTILDLGIGSTILRYISKHNAEKNKQAIENFSAMGVIQAGVLSAGMLIICVVVYLFIDKLYGSSLTFEELIKAKELFRLFAIILILNTFEKVVFNIISGCEHYAFSNSLKLIRIILKVVLAVLLLSRFSNSALLLWIDIGTIILTILLQLFFVRKKMQLKIRLTKWDWAVFKQSFRYTILMFIQSIATQINGNLDNVVIGAFNGANAVAIYSIGLQLYAMYEQFALAFSDLMLPTVSKQIADGADNEALENTVIKVGRFEFVMLGGALCGFAILGKEFITLWLGVDYHFAWTVGLVLMIPTTVPLIQNVCLSILRAKNKMGFRTIVVTCMAVLNLLITVVGVKYYGPIAACIGTAIGLIFANIIAMNVYYVKVLKLNVFRIFKGVLHKTLFCCIISSIALLLANHFIVGATWGLFIIKALIFCIVYFLTLVAFGFNSSEKEVLFGKLRRFTQSR